MRPGRTGVRRTAALWSGCPSTEGAHHALLIEVMAGESPARGSSGSKTVDRGGLQPHEWKRVERPEAVCEVAKQGLGSSGSTADSVLIGAVTEPKRRNRTPLTAKPIDAIQTAREGGENVMSIARRFEVSRMTVWEKTRPSELS